MIRANLLIVSIIGALVTAPLVYSQDLSKYREFQFGADPLTVAKLAHLKPSETRVIHTRPAVIQDLKWQAAFTYSSPRSDSAKEILFSFYNNELFRIVVSYDPERIEGMTAEDIVQSVSEKYGTAARPDTEITLDTTYFQGDGGKSVSEQIEKIIARWEDAEYSYNLIRPSYQSTFGMVMYSKRLDALARAAILESIRLDTQEAPQRATDLRMKKDEENRVKQEKARQVNKAPFRP
jgi:hypothetical protein